MFKQLKKQLLNTEILNGIYLIVQYCLMKEYVRAHDKYLELAIGNAPWPMGVTMVGIHERSGRSRIFSSQVAHILNDDTQRKYLQSIKRMLTVC
jgi:pre-mRNA-splicing factor 18